MDSTLPGPPKKPSRPPPLPFTPSASTATGPNNDVPTISINLETVNTTNHGETTLVNKNMSFSDHLISSPSFPNGFSSNDDENADLESQFSLSSRYNSGNKVHDEPLLTINNNEQDQISIMENELDELMNDNDGLITDLNLKDEEQSVEGYQIHMSNLIKKLSNTNDEDDNNKNIIDLSKSSGTNENNSDNLNEEESKIKFLQNKKQFFVLSSSGKPVYSFAGSDNLIINYMSIVQTLISSFSDPDLNPLIKSSTDDNLKSFSVGNSIKFLILNKSPIYLLAVSKLNSETTTELKNQLYIIYNYILSIISKKQLLKFYSMKSNFDLNNVLNASDFSILNKIIVSKILNPCFFLNGIESFYLQYSIKLKINQIIENFKSNDMLYGILSDMNGKVITIMKPKRHFLHTMDLQILLSIIFNKSIKSTLRNKIVIIVQYVAAT